VQPGETEDVCGTGLVAASAALELDVRLRHVVGVAHVGPAVDHGLQLFLHFLPHIEDARREGAEQPLVGVGRDEIDVRRRCRKGAERLDAVHAEKDLTGPQHAADVGNGRPPTGDEMAGGEGDEPGVFVDMRGDVDGTDATELLHFQEPHLHPALGQGHPRVDVRRIVVVVDEDVVGLAEADAVGDEAETERGGAHETDLVGPGADELGGEQAGLLEQALGHRVLLVAQRAVGRVAGDGLRHAPGQGRDAGMGKEGTLARGGEFVVAQFFVRQDLSNGHGGV
jgi:hypothetical protein